MDIGSLRDELIIQTYTAGSSDGAGGLAVGSYADTSTVWAHIKPMEGSRALEFGEITDKQPYDIVVRDNTIIDKKDRLKIKDSGQLLTIHNVYTTRRPFETRIVAFAVND